MIISKSVEKEFKVFVIFACRLSVALWGHKEKQTRFEMSVPTSTIEDTCIKVAKPPSLTILQAIQVQVIKKHERGHG